MLSEKPWRAETVLQYGVALFTCICLGAIAGELLRKFDVNGFSDADGFGPVLLATLSFQGATWPLLVLFLRRHHVPVRDEFGLRRPQIKRALRLAVSAAMVILPVAWLLQMLSGSVLSWLGREPHTQLPVALLENTQSVWLRVYLGVFAVGIAPVAEEFVFRGVLYPFIKQRGFPRLALFGVSALFALIHFDAATFLPLFALALAFTWLYETTDNLLAPVVAHSLFNTANLLLLLLYQSGILSLPK